MFRFMNKMKNRKGFTLIELIVVLAVLAIIMAIAVPRFIGVQEKAKVNADISTKEMVTKAAELYFASTTSASTTVTVEALKSGGYLSDVKFNNTSNAATSASIDGNGKVTLNK